MRRLFTIHVHARGVGDWKAGLVNYVYTIIVMDIHRANTVVVLLGIVIVSVILTPKTDPILRASKMKHYTVFSCIWAFCYLGYTITMFQKSTNAILVCLDPELL